MRILRWIAPLAMVGLMAVTLGKASAQDLYGAPDNYVQATNANMTSLIDRIEALEAAVVNEDEEDAWESVHGEKWSGKVGGRVMWDMVNFPEVDNAIGDDTFENFWEFRRIRIFLSGSGYGMYEYKLQLDFEPEAEGDEKDSGVSIKDLYVGLTDVCFFQHIRFGHFKEAHGLENLTSSKYITFMERYAATKVFAPERNVGLQAYMCSCDDSIGLQYGVFLPRSFDDLDETDHERIQDTQGVDLVARVFASPYYCGDGRHLIHVGAGYWYSHPSELAGEPILRDRIRPGTHEGGRIINATALTDVDYFHTFNLEAAAVWGPLSVQGEFFAKYFEDDVIGDQSYYGAYAFVSYFLTGENRNYDRCSGDFGRVKPHTNFWAVPTCCDCCCIGSGAWEVAARWQYYDNSDDPTAFAGEANAYTLGVNWYLNPYVRTMFNYEHWDADYNNGQNGEVDWVGMRVQWDF